MPTKQRNSRNNKVAQLLWLLGGGFVIVLVASFGYMYLRGVFREKPEYTIENSPGLENPRFPLMVVSLTNALTAGGNLTNFWLEAEEIYTARLNAIRRAERLIQFETYFMTPGRRADEFAEALMERARAGVTVQLLLDAHGTGEMPDRYWERLRETGIEVRFFREFDVRAPLEYNSRTHRKLLLIDGREVLIGGAGVSDYWDGEDGIENTAPWLEFEVSYEGQIVSLLEGNFLQNWAYTGGTVDLGKEIIQVQPDEGYTLYITNDTSTLSESSMRMLFQISFLAAQERIWIGSPYFVPETNTREVLIQAKENGVDVRVLTMSEKNDKPLVHFAARELYGDLLEAGIQICEYQPSMMHAKFKLIDDDWVSTGSANFDPRSYFHNDELNISTNHPQLVANIDRFFVDAVAQSDCLTYEQWQNRSLREKLLGRVSLIFKNLL